MELQGKTHAGLLFQKVMSAHSDLPKEGAVQDGVENKRQGKHQHTGSGAQLSCMSQALAHRGIHELKACSPWNSTIINLDITRHTVKAISGKTPTDATI